MSKFKGTKGKWIVSDYDDSSNCTNINTETKRICEVKHYRNQIDKILQEPSIEEGKSNAILISKAPEMLEMLERLVEIIDFSVEHWQGNSGREIEQEIKQLIKDATE